MQTMENEKGGERDGNEREKRKESRKAGLQPLLGPASRELARKNLKPEGHIIQNQEMNLIVSRPFPHPSDE